VVQFPITPPPAPPRARKQPRCQRPQPLEYLCAPNKSGKEDCKQRRADPTDGQRPLVNDRVQVARPHRRRQQRARRGRGRHEPRVVGQGGAALRLLTNRFLGLYFYLSSVRLFPSVNAKEVPTVHPPDGPLDRLHPLECKPLNSVWHPSQGPKREYSADYLLGGHTVGASSTGFGDME